MTSVFRFADYDFGVSAQPLLVDADGEDVVFGLEYEDGRPFDEVDLVYA